jgi:hypothetical protein
MRRLEVHAQKGLSGAKIEDLVLRTSLIRPNTHPTKNLSRKRLTYFHLRSASNLSNA